MDGRGFVQTSKKLHHSDKQEKTSSSRTDPAAKQARLMFEQRQDGLDETSVGVIEQPVRTKKSNEAACADLT
jgi:hypothetical protein